MTGGGGAPFAAHVSKGSTGIMLALSIAMIGLGLAQWLSGMPAFYLLGGFIVLFFGAAAVVLVRRLRDPRPVIEIDARGVLWRYWSDDRIPWTAISGATVKRMRHQRFLCLELLDADAHPPRRRVVRLGGVNRLFGFGDIAIGTDGTDCEVDDVAAAVARYRPVER